MITQNILSQNSVLNATSECYNGGAGDHVVASAEIAEEESPDYIGQRDGGKHPTQIHKRWCFLGEILRKQKVN